MLTYNVNKLTNLDTCKSLEGVIPYDSNVNLIERVVSLESEFKLVSLSVNRMNEVFHMSLESFNGMSQEDMKAVVNKIKNFIVKVFEAIGKFLVNLLNTIKKIFVTIINFFKTPFVKLDPNNVIGDKTLSKTHVNILNRSTVETDYTIAGAMKFNKDLIPVYLNKIEKNYGVTNSSFNVLNTFVKQIISTPMDLISQSPINVFAGIKAFNKNYENLLTTLDKNLDFTYENKNIKTFSIIRHPLPIIEEYKEDAPDYMIKMKLELDNYKIITFVKDKLKGYKDNRIKAKNIYEFFNTKSITDVINRYIVIKNNSEVLTKQFNIVFENVIKAITDNVRVIDSNTKYIKQIVSKLNRLDTPPAMTNYILQLYQTVGNILTEYTKIFNFNNRSMMEVFKETMNVHRTVSSYGKVLDIIVKFK